jgi:hypothetical protein
MKEAAPVKPILTHIRRNTVGYLALFVALGGTSYAALTISGSQIRNGTINAVKFNPKTISASIRAWAVIYADGSGARAGAASSQVHVQATGTGEVVTWPHQRFGRNCFASASPQITVSSGPYGTVTTQFDPTHGRLTLYGFGPDKVGRPQAADVMIVCS